MQTHYRRIGLNSRRFNVVAATFDIVRDCASSPIATETPVSFPSIAEIFYFANGYRQLTVGLLLFAAKSSRVGRLTIHSGPQLFNHLLTVMKVIRDGA
jgi:hypothetical protein